jgi:putative acetyltransferase
MTGKTSGSTENHPPGAVLARSISACVPSGSREIRIDPIEDEQVVRLIRGHLERMREGSPKESVHALDIEELRGKDITFWTLWINEEPAGCGALKELNPLHGEVKSMRTGDAYLRQGVAREILGTIIEEARFRGYEKISLETGSASSFLPAHALYRDCGFLPCGPFEGYGEDPHSVFMAKALLPG